MTAPVDDFGFFGVVLTSDGTSYMRPKNTTRPLVTGTGVRLDPGVYRVAASFDGPNEVELRLHSPKLGDSTKWNLREVLGTIPAGGRGRCGWPPSAQQTATTYKCNPRQTSSQVLSAPSKFSAPQTNPDGGGVGDRVFRGDVRLQRGEILVQGWQQHDHSRGGVGAHRVHDFPGGCHHHDEYVHAGCVAGAGENAWHAGKNPHAGGDSAEKRPYRHQHRCTARHIQGHPIDPHPDTPHLRGHHLAAVGVAA